MKRQVLLASAASLLVLSVASAQEDERDIIVTTGVGTLAPSTDTLQAVDVLVPAEIIGDFDNTLGDTLADLPGLSVTSFGPAVGRPVIRGLGGDRVRILTNGVGVIDVSNVSQDHAGTTEVIEAERIDILRGPAAIAYGGGAVGGVVNVIDGSIPTSLPEDLFDGQLYAGGETVDDSSEIAGRFRTRAGQLALQIEGSFREADPYSIPGFTESELFRMLEEAEEHGEEEEGEEHDEEEDEEAFGVVENSDYEFTTFGGGASWIGDWGHIGFAIRQFDADYGLPGGHEHGHGEEEGEEHEGEEEHEEEEEEGGIRLDMEQTRYSSTGAFRLNFGVFNQLTYSATYADYEHAEIEPSGEVGTLFTNEGWEARAALQNGTQDTVWSGSVGVQGRDTEFSAVGEEAFTPPVDTTELGVFAAQRVDFGGYGFEGGARFEMREMDSVTGVSRDFETVSLAAGGFLRPQEGVFLGANIALTERAPTDLELFSNGPHAATGAFEIGNPDFDAETALALDLVGHVYMAGWHIEAGAFYTDYSDFIFLAPTDEIDEDEELPIFRYLQDDAVLWGGEFFAERALGAFNGWAFDGDVTLEYVRAETDSLGDLPRIPPFSAIVGANVERSWLNVRAEAEFVAEQDDIATFELPTDSYTLVNLGATVTPWANDDLRFIVELKNLTDEEARLHASPLKDTVPLPGRSLRLAVATKF